MEPDEKGMIAERGSDRSRKRPYAAPALTRHGDVRAITEVLRMAVEKGQTGTIIDTPT